METNGKPISHVAESFITLSASVRGHYEIIKKPRKKTTTVEPIYVRSRQSPANLADWAAMTGRSPPRPVQMRWRRHPTAYPYAANHSDFPAPLKQRKWCNLNRSRCRAQYVSIRRAGDGFVPFRRVWEKENFPRGRSRNLSGDWVKHPCCQGGVARARSGTPGGQNSVGDFGLRRYPRHVPSKSQEPRHPTRAFR